MDVQEVLQWVDELVLSNKGKHLTNLQQAVLLGVWDSQRYKEIAQTYRCSEANVKKAVIALWDMLSEELNEKVSKSNFRSAMERYHIHHVSIVGDGGRSNFIQGNINVCRESQTSAGTPKERSPSTSNPDKVKVKQRHNITDAPERAHPFCERTGELTTLKQWILEENIRTITLIGLAGIGKTSLAVEFVEQIKHNFDLIVWRSHQKFPTLESLNTNLMEFFSEQQQTQLPSIIDYLSAHRCLIILDDLQETFARGELAGTYLPEYRHYGKFLKQLAVNPHKSCLLLLSWENPIEIATLEAENRHCRTLLLNGLGNSARDILKERGLTDEEKWSELIDMYAGNPSWLKIIATTIVQLFNGSVAQFLSCPTPFLGDLDSLLLEHYQRLSESEKLILLWLASHEWLQLTRKPAEFTFSHSDFLKTIQSLSRRCLIEKITEKGGSYFTLQAVIKEYVREKSL